jgi:sugar/nucleoside kinase (ribokinase family)
VDVVCLGILVADAIARPVDDPPARRTLALVDAVSLTGRGCAVDRASALVRLGSSAPVAGKIGTDARGQFLVRVLDDRAEAAATHRLFTAALESHERRVVVEL